jgi:hypothetical protein
MGLVLMRCSCGLPLVVDEGPALRLNLGQFRIFKDTGKVVGTCRRCPKEHVIDAGSPLVLPDTSATATVTSRIRCVSALMLAEVR